jgi:signal transduction histidine kinase
VLKFSSKGSKLIIIFILTVFVSGSILTYLSFTQISNYRELLEKKISEEERELTNRFASDFHVKLDTLKLSFSKYILQDSSGNTPKLKHIDSINGFIDYVEIDANGSFIIPYFTDNKTADINVKTSSSYSNAIRSAEKNEFVLKDFKSSELAYLKALKRALIRMDSVHVYNSLGRLYVKMGLEQKAFETYQKILNGFYNTLNASGFPYTYFSIIKLLKISDPSNNKELRKSIISFLKRLNQREIPLNQSSHEIFELILEWLNSFENDSENQLISSLIRQCEKSLQLIDNYKLPIENTLRENKEAIAPPGARNYFKIKPSSGSKNELMFLHIGQNKSTGFVIGLIPLFSKVLEQNQYDNFTFEYEVTLAEKEAGILSMDTNIVSRNVFTSYFEDSLIQVSLKNENIIEEKVFNKRFTYGIGLFVFFGIMVLGLYLLIQDVKREKRIQKLREDFVSNVTHELKTPLTAINMFAEAMDMKKDNLDSNQKKYAKIIVKESEKLKRMINNILEYTRNENSKLSYILKKSNLTDVVCSTLEEMNYFLEISEMDVHLNISNEMYANVEPEGIKQALSNLISNAIKYSSSNKRLNIHLYKEGNRIFIEVEDFGMGIPNENLELIFEKFYRVNSKENEAISGTGLGLTVTKAIVEEQQGELLVESILGKGSKFTIILNAA